MSIDNIPDKIKDFVDPGTKSATKFCIFSVVVFVVIAVLSILIHGFFPLIKYPVELIQAVLVCSTALMGLTGLMITETKKSKIRDLPSDGIQRVRAINQVSSLARALVFLKWSFFLSIISIIFSVLWLINGSSVSIVVSIIAFLGQLYLLLFALIFSDYLPS